jgi:hypothetical protein
MMSGIKYLLVVGVPAVFPELLYGDTEQENK